ncbi:NAD(P)-binding protein, partial [Bimuria novae-zelandiae CBS 107.79]
MASTKAPLRTALIGLSSSAKTSWASAAHLPGLLTPTGRSKLPITALLNSSVQAAKSAIDTYKLAPETKAYGSPEDLANDPNVDLVICNTRVDKHFETILPSIKKGKDVFVEWPIASNLADIDTLVQEAKKSGSRVAVGLQRRWVPPAVKLREIIKDGVNGKKLGKILSVDVRAYGGTNDRDIVPEGLKYFLQRGVGGNVIVIGIGHSLVLDLVLSVVGDLDPETAHAQLQLQRPDVRIRDPSTNKIIETVRSNVPDLVSLHGPVKSSATLSFLFRRGQPFPGTPALTWTINLEHGEISLVAPSGTALELGEPATIHVHWFDGDNVEEIKWNWNAELSQLPASARQVFSTLIAFADGNAPGDGWVSIEDAANRAKLIESFLGEWE